MAFYHHAIILFLLPIIVISLTGAKKHSAIVGDCGSTGTRLYYYEVYVEDEGHKLTQLNVTKVATLTPGASTQWRSRTLEDILAADIVDSVKPLLDQTNDGISVWHGLSLLGTGGIRRMNSTNREDLWNRLERELSSRLPYNVPLQVGDIPGELEALYALTSVSYLFQEEADGREVGVLDLGGRSLEISNPPMPPLNSLEALEFTREPSNDDNQQEQEEALVEVVSLDIGERNLKKWIHFERPSEEHLCIFKEEGSIGNADGCRGLLREYLDEHRGPVLADYVARDTEYVGIGLLIYAIDFAHWMKPIPSYPHITVDDLIEHAAESVCNTPFNHTLFTSHSGTKLMVEAKGRSELLRDMNLTSMTVGHPVGDVDLEWTLGYLLREAATIDIVKKSTRKDEL